MNNAKEFSIGEFSKRTGISIRNLRYYDEIGLLVPAKQPSSGHRIYKYQDIITLQKILSLKFLGYSLEGITALLHQSSFTVDLNETLTHHLNALEAEKEKLERSMNAIRRVISLLKEEGEVDSNLLFSLINGLPAEHMQKNWLEKHHLKEVVEGLSQKTVEENITLDQTFVQMTKKVRRLYGKPIEDMEVQAMVESYIEETLSFLGEDLMQVIVNVHLEEQELQDLEDMTPSPFTEREQKWLIQAIDYYMEKKSE
ncbi:MerR family transcriptional regulator [Gracilibacillus oryzae]|uniref:MerR family transcriptional regulator n=1 Tax=Gracilibacillus oryzae TaxID=1672701 RepID=A0A7C8KP89_9BACI|nr:MerR family transcriptional regulator [Gracilibacillus oryzae]KAB8130296.1 MerR family transcriptional regulator [Gracilibacillus oryzae]